MATESTHLEMIMETLSIIDKPQESNTHKFMNNNYSSVNINIPLCHFNSNKIIYNYSNVDLSAYSSEHSLIIFDWDDTFFPTTFISNCTNVEEISAGEMSQIHVIEILVMDIIVLAKLLGECCIVSNASESWIMSCINKYYPHLYEILDNKVSIISSMDRFTVAPIFKDPSVDGNTIRKYETFKEEVLMRNVDGNNINRIISVGDSDIEKDALHLIHKIDPTIILISVKLLSYPSLKNLFDELMTIKKNLRKMVTQKESTDFIFQA